MDASIRSTLAALALGTALVGSLAAPAAAGKVNESFFGVAVKGYDVVAYFTEGAPTKGEKAFTHEWMGASWRFASAANRDAFAGDPERYAPAYRGFCAYAVAYGGLADIDPKAWTIHEGRLFLNLDLDVQARWLADVPGFVARADARWPELSGGR